MGSSGVERHDAHPRCRNLGDIVVLCARCRFYVDPLECSSQSDERRGVEPSKVAYRTMGAERHQCVAVRCSPAAARTCPPYTLCVTLWKTRNGHVYKYSAEAAACAKSRGTQAHPHPAS